MKTSSLKQHITGLSALLLFALFACTMLAVLLTGARVYGRIAERDDRSYTHRTAAQYLSTKVQQADSALLPEAEDFCGTPSLTLRQDLGGLALLTRIYCYDGYLRELYCLSDSELTPADGEKILPMEQLDVSIENGLLLLRLTDEDGISRCVVLALRGGEEVRG